MKKIPTLTQIRPYNQPLLGIGLLLIVSGIFAVLIVDTTNWWNLTLVILGVVVLGLFLAANLSEVKAVGRKRSTILQANLALVAAAMFGIVCGLNYVISRHPIRFDLTANKFYTLSEQTTSTLKKLKQDVNVTLFTSSKRSSAEVQRAQQLLEEYSKSSSRFHFKAIDVDKDPTQAKRLGIHEYNTVVFESGDNRKDVLQRDYVTYPLQGSRPVPKFQGEGAFTSALIKMSDTTHPIVYFIQGHGEKDLNDPQSDGFNVFNDMLQKQNYTTKTLNILTLSNGKIPEDAAVLAVIGPTKPFQSGEVDMMRNYLQNGGKLVLCVDPQKSTGLDLLLKDFGIKLGNDLVVDPTRCIYPNPGMVIPQIMYHPIVEKLSEEHVDTFMPFCRSVQKVDAILKNVTQTVFLQTTDKGWGVTNMKEKRLAFHPGVDLKGRAPIAMACEWVPSGATTAKAPDMKTRLVVYGGTSFITNQFVQQMGNLDLGLNAFNWVAMQENKISIHPKEEDARVMNLSNVAANAITYLTVWIMPLSILVIGGLIWYRRRSL